MTVQMPNLSKFSFLFYQCTVVESKQITVFTKLTIPRKQQKKAGLQKGAENAAEAICCPIFKGRWQMLWFPYISIVSGWHKTQPTAWTGSVTFYFYK
jgi:hypothetical protein